MKKVEVIYEDDGILAVNKPSGLSVHSDGVRKESTLVDWIVENYPDVKDIGEPVKLSSGKVITRSGIVHRLDKDTSGVLLVAKTQESFEFLKKQFQDKKITKVYQALAYGQMEESVGSIDKSIGRSGKDFRMRVALADTPIQRKGFGDPRSSRDDIRGEVREAKTEYKVLYTNAGYSFVELYPLTGRTHQLRVHLASIGHPVVCDSLYAKGRVCPEEVGRLALHALKISFTTLSGEQKMVEAPLADEIESGLKKLLPNN